MELDPNKAKILLCTLLVLIPDGIKFTKKSIEPMTISSIAIVRYIK